MKKAKRIAWWLFRAAMVLLVVFYAAAGAVTLWFGRQVESKTRAIAARGEPITVADIAGGARGPGAAAFEAAMKRFAAIKVSDREAEAVARLISQSGRQATPEDWSAGKAALPKLGPALDELGTARAAGEVSVGFDLSGDSDNSFKPLSEIRSAVRALAARAVVRTRGGDAPGATADLETALWVSQAPSPRGAMIGALVRIACVNLSCSGIQSCLRTEAFSNEQTRRLCEALDSATPDDLISQAMLYERAVSHMYFQMMLRGETDFGGNRLPGDKRGLVWKLETLPMRAMLYANESVALDAIGREVELMRKPYRELGNTRVETDVIEQMPRWAVLAKLLVPVFIRARAAADRGAATVEATKALLSLERYRTANGSYPSALAEGRMPGCEFGDDPFSGKPLVYRRQGDGFVLYSIGEDLKDNGGKRPPKDNRSAPGTDLVWAMP